MPIPQIITMAENAVPKEIVLFSSPPLSAAAMYTAISITSRTRKTAPIIMLFLVLTMKSPINAMGPKMLTIAPAKVVDLLVMYFISFIYSNII